MSAPVLNLREFPAVRPYGAKASDGLLPPDVVRIDRATRFGNPFRIGESGDRQTVIRKYRAWLVAKLRVDPTFLDPLRGHRLACWCSPLACHGDVILEALGAASIAIWLEAA